VSAIQERFAKMAERAAEKKEAEPAVPTESDS
jgi:hypothetical protein